MSIPAINAALRRRNCPHRENKTLWQWIDKRAKGYCRRTFVGLGAKQQQATQTYVVVTPYQSAVKTTTSITAAAESARKARIAARENGSSIDFAALGTDPIVYKPEKQNSSPL